MRTRKTAAMRRAAEERRLALPGGVMSNYVVAYVRKTGEAATLTIIASSVEDAKKQWDRIMALVPDEIGPIPDSVPVWLR